MKKEIKIVRNEYIDSSYWANYRLALLTTDEMSKLDPDDTVVCIDGQLTKVKDADGDTRGGRTAYGYFVENAYKGKN